VRRWWSRGDGGWSGDTRPEDFITAQATRPTALAARADGVLVLRYLEDGDEMLDKLRADWEQTAALNGRNCVQLLPTGPYRSPATCDPLVSAA